MTARGLAAGLAALAAAGLGGSGASAMTGMGDHGATDITAARVPIAYAAFATPYLDVIAGDTVTWVNDSVRPHDIVAADFSFDSGRLATGAEFARRFDDPGAVPYLCSLHPFMTGEIDVHTLLLDVPTERGAPNKPFVVGGRVAAGTSGAITIEGDDGSGFKRAGTATVAGDGTFRASVVPRTTTSYRAVSGDQQSPPVQLLVLDRKVSVSAAHDGRSTTLSVSVAPAAPDQQVVLQLRLRDRFGWWPVQHKRLSAASTARFVMTRKSTVPARIVLTLPDGATELARSRTVRLGPLR
jgi:plastocyanin